jgi:hypothetical protein
MNETIRSPELDLFKDTLFNVEKSHPLEKHVGKKCYRKFTGNDPSWGIEINGVLVNRAHGEEYEEDNMILTHPSEEPQVFVIGHLQKGWGHNEKGQYVPNIIMFRIYRDGESGHSNFGCPSLSDDVIFID